MVDRGDVVESERARAEEPGAGPARRRLPRWAQVAAAALGGPVLAGAVALLLAPTPWGPLTLGGEDGTRSFSLCTPIPAGRELYDGQVALDPGAGNDIRIDGVRLLEAGDLQLVEAALAPPTGVSDGSTDVPGLGTGWPPEAQGLEPAVGALVGSGAEPPVLVLRLRATGPNPRFSGARVDYTWQGRARYAVTGEELALKARCS